LAGALEKERVLADKQQRRLFIDPTLLFEGVCFGVQSEAAIGALPETSSRIASIAAPQSALARCNRCSFTT